MDPFPRLQQKHWFPDAPCMDYLPTLAEEWPHPRGNVGKYFLHGASGVLLHSGKLTLVMENPPFGW